jgi:hypothetical protein
MEFYSVIARDKFIGPVPIMGEKMNIVGRFTVFSYSPYNDRVTWKMKGEGI